MKALELDVWNMDGVKDGWIFGDLYRVERSDSSIREHPVGVNGIYSCVFEGTVKAGGMVGMDSFLSGVGGDL